MIELVIIAALALGCIAGFVLRRLTYAVAAATVLGFGMAIAYYHWLGADPTRGDALASIGYFIALAVPLSGCALGWLASRFKRTHR